MRTTAAFQRYLGARVISPDMRRDVARARMLSEQHHRAQLLVEEWQSRKYRYAMRIHVEDLRKKVQEEIAREREDGDE